MKVLKNDSTIITYWVLMIIALCSGFSAYADENIKTIEAGMPKTLEELKIAIEKVRIESKLIGLGVSVVDKNGSILAAGFGEANITSHKPVTQDTLFRIGSTSKMFVALSILQLVEQGKLHLNDKLSDLAPEIYFENKWEDKNPIRLVHLLEHTTGWSDIGLSIFAYQDAEISLEKALAFHPKYRKSRWVPGTRFAYNNAGPAVAAYVVQKITGQLYEDYVQEHFFNPLQMTTATFFESDLFRKNGVTLYSSDGSEIDYWNFILRPAGAINASTADMSKYLQFLISRGEYSHQRLINEKSFARMETPTTTLGAQIGTQAGYGLHNYVTGFKSANIAFRGHDGDIAGGHCRLSYVPELNAGYVIMINQDNGNALDKIQTLIRSYLLQNVRKNVHQSMALPEKFNQLSGYYIPIALRDDSFALISELMGVMRITVSDNKLHRMPLLGGWPSPSNDYAINENVLVSTYTGLPTIAVVNDPLIGEAVEVSDGPTLKRVSSFWVFGILGLIGCTLVFSVTSILFAPIWVMRLIRGNFSSNAALSIYLWPLMTCVIPVIGICVVHFFATMKTLGIVSPVTLSIFICSSLYPVFAIYSLINIYNHRGGKKLSSVMYWHSALVSICHVCLAIILAQDGMLLLRLWA